MDKNSGELPSPTPKINFDRSFLEYQNIKEIEQQIPLAKKDQDHVETISGSDLVQTVHDLTTEGGDRPYQSADVTIENITDFSKIKLTQTYLQEQRINNLVYLTMSLRSRGVDLFHLDGITTVTDENNNQEVKISPPVVEVNGNGQYKLVSGHQRFFTAYLLGTDIDVATIRNFDESHARPYEPVDFDQVTIVKSPPPIELRRTLIPGHSEKDFIDFTTFGEDGKRRNRLESENSYFPEDPIVGSKNKARKLKAEVNQFLQQINPNSSRFEGMFPSAVLGKEGTFSRVEELLDAKPFDDNHLLTVMKIDVTDKNGIERKATFYPVAKTKEFSQNTSANQIVILSPNEILNQSKSSPPDGEIIIPSEIRDQINQFLTQKKLRLFTANDPLKDSDNLPKVIDFSSILDAEKYHTEITLKLDNGRSIGYVLNRQDKKKDVSIYGSTFVVRDNQDNIVFVEHYRELFGMVFLELPRMFGFDLQRLQQEIGYDLSDKCDLDQVSIVSENSGFSTSTNTVFSVALPPDIKSLPPKDTTSEYFENSTVIHKTDQEINQIIADGMLNCKITNASITLDQISHNKLAINPEFKDYSIILEEYYFPPEGRYYLRPVATKTNLGTRINQNSFSNTGICLDYDHVELGNQQSLPEGKCYRQIPISEIITKITDGSMDTDTIADLSTALRHQNILTLV